MASSVQKQKLPPFSLLLLVSFALILLITYQTFRDRKSVADLMKVKDSAIEDLEENLKVNLSIFIQIIESSFLSFLCLHQILALAFLSFEVSYMFLISDLIRNYEKILILDSVPEEFLVFL